MRNPEKILTTNNILHEDVMVSTSPVSDGKRELKIVWRNVFIFTLLHLGALYGVYLYLFKAMWATCIFEYVYGTMAGIGITAGAHRLWAHKSYKAKLPFKIILVILQTVAIQNSVIEWTRDHRMHHKYSETDADPHNAKRGFFFAHMGWLFVKKHPEIKAKGNTIDMSDLWADPVLRFQHRYYKGLVVLTILASFTPLLWGESVLNSVLIAFNLRYIQILHTTWLVNSVAHMWGMKPYDKTINPVETNIVSILTQGEGFHNYHHVFPWDYKASELRHHSSILTTFVIEAMAKIGWAYDLKTVPANVIESRTKKTGDGSHKKWGTS